MLLHHYYSARYSFWLVLLLLVPRPVESFTTTTSTTTPRWSSSSSAVSRGGVSSAAQKNHQQTVKTTKKVLLVSSDDNNQNEEGTSNVLFDDYHSGDTERGAKFGESVPLKRPSGEANFGESVPLRNKHGGERTDTTTNGDLFSPMTARTNSISLGNDDVDNKTKDELQKMRERNIIVTVAAVFFAVFSYIWQFTHPITPIQLLTTMQSNSAPLTSIGTNGRPTVVDFWAPWCENCKTSAPTLQKLEEEYKDQVNFVMVNGDRPDAWPLIERFGVDAIPHMALISAEGDVETALIGPITKRVLEEDLNVLLANANANANEKKVQLPYTMMDAFANRPNDRRVHFDETVQNK